MVSHNLLYWGLELGKICIGLNLFPLMTPVCVICLSTLLCIRSTSSLIFFSNSSLMETLVSNSDMLKDRWSGLVLYAFIPCCSCRNARMSTCCWAFWASEFVDWVWRCFMVLRFSWSSLSRSSVCSWSFEMVATVFTEFPLLDGLKVLTILGDVFQSFPLVFAWDLVFDIQ